MSLSNQKHHRSDPPRHNIIGMVGLALSVLGVVGLGLLNYRDVSQPLGLGLLFLSPVGTVISAVSLSQARGAAGGSSLLDIGLWGLGMGLVVTLQIPSIVFVGFF